MSEMTAIVPTDPLAQSFASHHSDFVVASPRINELSPSRIMDCLIRVQDILVSPSPICKRTRRQLQLRQTANLQTAIEECADELPLDLSLQRALVTETPVSTPTFECTIDPHATPVSLAQIDLKMLHCATELENEIRQQPLTCGISPVSHLTPDEVQILRNIQVTESPLSIFPAVFESKGENGENVGDPGTCSETSRQSPSLPDDKTPPAVQIGSVDTPIKMQQVDYFPFSLRCAFCDLELSSFSEHILEIHAGCSESQIGVIRRRADQSPSPPSSDEKKPLNNSSASSAEESPLFKCEKCKDQFKNEASLLQHVCSPSPSRSWSFAHRTPKAKRVEFTLSPVDVTLPPHNPTSESSQTDSPKIDLLSPDPPLFSNVVVGHPSQDTPTLDLQDDNRFHCKKCSFQGPSENVLESHVYEVHSPVFSPSYETTRCSSSPHEETSCEKEAIYTDSGLTVAVLSQKCPLCSTICSSSVDLLSHECGAIGGEPVPPTDSPNRNCPVCGFVVRAADEKVDGILRRHVYNKHSCQKCSFTERMNGELKKHMRQCRGDSTSSSGAIPKISRGSQSKSVPNSLPPTKPILELPTTHVTQLGPKSPAHEFANGNSSQAPPGSQPVSNNSFPDDTPVSQESDLPSSQGQVRSDPPPPSIPNETCRIGNSINILFPISGCLPCTEVSCGFKSFGSSYNICKRSLKRHLETHHQIQIRACYFWCFLCQSRITRHPAAHGCLKNTALLIPPDTPFEWKCNSCDLSFPTEIGLKNHALAHKMRNIKNSGSPLTLVAPKRIPRRGHFQPVITEPGDESLPAPGARINADNPDILTPPATNSEEDSSILKLFIVEISALLEAEATEGAFKYFCNIVDQAVAEIQSSVLNGPPRDFSNSPPAPPVNTKDPKSIQILFKKNPRKSVRAITKTDGERCKIPISTLENHFSSAWGPSGFRPDYFRHCEDNRVPLLDTPFTIRVMLIEKKPPHEIAISGGVDETADFSKASDVLECDDVENDMRVLTSTPKIKSNFTENGFNSTPKKIKFLNGKVRYFHKKIQRLTEKKSKICILQKIKSIVQPVIYNFIKSQIQQTSVAKNGRRYSLQDKNLALQLYLASPKAYGLVRKYFCFPSKKTLRRSLAAIDIEPGFIPSVEKALKLVASKMTPLDKLCILSFDEMKIKMGLSYHKKNDVIIRYENYGNESSSKLATHVLVFRVRGPCKKWKQVIGRFFSCRYRFRYFFENANFS
ncbi:hypothetical protein AVEN_124500-1 [Araneus ventricosus]|uniref:C2H2-type domain-containing protein n=1 Tax=Araneus ventricosus TaxID=182803 RepID=A0A4Y2KRT4_ARAVE|nr:hypothetical protein AVEN_124500-1 [Araneus ventricosus]